MGTVDVLRGSVQHTHDNLAARFASARTMVSTPGQPRKAYEGIDTFLAIASKHLSAVDAVLLPAARRRLPDGAHVVHDYLHSARHLEVMLAHVKARAYGSVFEAGHHWAEVWDDVGEALAAHRRCEADLADQLTGAIDAGELDELTEKLHRAESSAPTRPHPYAPHTGLAGLVARKIMHAVDAFWDTAEGRMSPEPNRPQKKKPGIVAQYFLADPRFDEEETGPEAGDRQPGRRETAPPA
jgi:hypothetical protein